MILVLCTANRVLARLSQLPNHETGRVWRRPTAHQLPQPFHLRRARWRRRAAVAAVPSPVALDGLPVCPALTMTRPVSFLLPVMVGPLLRGHLEQRRPAAETVEPRLSAPRHGTPASNSARVRRVPSASHRRRWSRMRRASRSACSARARARFSALAGSWVVTRHQPLASSRWSYLQGPGKTDVPTKNDGGLP